jgi:hypothetical protein
MVLPRGARGRDYGKKKKMDKLFFIFAFFFSFSLGLPFSFHHRSHTDTIPV